MIDALIENDYQKIAWLETSLKDISDTNYVGLYIYEHIAIDYLSSNFQEILPNIHYLDSNQTPYANTSLIFPRSDQLSNQLANKMLEKKELTTKSIKNSYLSEEEKDLLLINQILWIGSADTTMKQDSLNEMSKLFLANYPNSSYGNFIKENTLFEYEKSKWGLGFDFFTGFGWFDGNLATYFKPTIPFGVAFDIQYKSVILYLRNYIGFSGTKIDIEYVKDVWEKDETALVFIPEATLGYPFLETPKVKTAIFGGISSMDIGPTLNKSDTEPYDEIDLDFRSAPCFGINFDLKLKPAYNIVTQYGNEESYTYLRLRYSYHQPNYVNRFDGGYHSFVIAFGGFGNSVKRKEY